MKKQHRLLIALLSCVLVVAWPWPGAGAAKPQIDLQELAKRVHELVNRERESHGLAPLAWNEALADIAWKHSQDMLEKKYLSHVNKRGETPTDRGNKAGYRCRKKYGNFYEEGLAENLCRNSLFHATKYTTFGADLEIKERLWNTLEDIAVSTVRSWMESEEHRENILNPRHDTEGIGIAVADDGKVYITQLFC